MANGIATQTAPGAHFSGCIIPVPCHKPRMNSSPPPGLRAASARWLASAPGRVNLIGEHVDYCDGFVLPAIIGLRTWMAAAPRADDRIVVEIEDGQRAEITPQPGAEKWANYLRGVLAGFLKTGAPVPGMDVRIASTLPQGAGLASSAALCVAFASLLEAASSNNVEGHVTGDGSAAQAEAPGWKPGDAGWKPALPFSTPASCSRGPGSTGFQPVRAGFQPDCHHSSSPPPHGTGPLEPDAKARLCQDAEALAGVPSGCMDQLAAVHGRAGHALLIDCRSREVEHIPLGDAALLIINTGVRHDLADGKYAERRAETEAAARLLGVPSLRDATREFLEAARLPDILHRRARHVISEIERTQNCAEALRAGDHVRAGLLMNASHSSLADDFEVSCLELDDIAAITQGQKGVFGCRMTGGGFGGCCVALVQPAALTAVRDVLTGFCREELGAGARVIL
jgi:galactokinase